MKDHPVLSIIRARNAAVEFGNALMREGLPRSHPIIQMLIRMVSIIDRMLEDIGIKLK